MALQSLPVETLERVSSLLEPQDFMSFSLSCKYLNDCTRSVLFRSVCIRPAGLGTYPADIATDVESFRQMLMRRGAFRHVRRFRLTGWSKDYRKLSQNGWTEEFVCRRQLIEHVYADDHKWMPLAELIQDLPGLTDFIHEHRRQISPCILAALRPTCRLHMEMFHLTSLVVKGQSGGLDLRDILADEHEVDVATSKNLHSVHIFTFAYGRGIRDLNGKAVEDMVRALAPNLKSVTWGTHWEIHDFNEVPTVESIPDQTPNTPRRRWPSLPGDGGGGSSDRDGQIPRYALDVANTKKGRLQHLAISQMTKYVPNTQVPAEWWGHPAIEVPVKWETLSNFADLETFSLDEGKLVAIRHLQTCPFQRLKNLSIAFWDPKEEFWAKEDYGVVDDLVSSLPSLYRLSLGRKKGMPSESLIRAIGHTHGSTLRTLVLPTMPWLGTFKMSARVLESMANSCPRLEELTLELPRSEGDRDEVARYKALGAFRNLKVVEIKLMCAYMQVNYDGTHTPVGALDPSTASDPSTFERELFDDFTMPPGRPFGFDEDEVSPPPEMPKVVVPQPTWLEHRTQLINCAIDETLVRSIFRVISSLNGDASRLERIKIEPDGGRYSCRGSIHERIFNHFLIRRYTCERISRSRSDLGCYDDLRVAMEQRRVDLSTEIAHTSLFVLRSIWPHVDRFNWRKVYTSLPLQIQGQPPPPPRDWTTAYVQHRRDKAAGVKWTWKTGFPGEFGSWTEGGVTTGS